MRAALAPPFYTNACRIGPQFAARQASAQRRFAPSADLRRDLLTNGGQCELNVGKTMEDLLRRR